MILPWFYHENPSFIDDVPIYQSSGISPPLAQDCVDGLIWSTENLARLDGYPDIKVVYRTDWSKDKVGAPKVDGTGKYGWICWVGDKFLFAVKLRVIVSAEPMTSYGKDVSHELRGFMVVLLPFFV